MVLQENIGEISNYPSPGNDLKLSWETGRCSHFNNGKIFNADSN